MRRDPNLLFKYYFNAAWWSKKQSWILHAGSRLSGIIFLQIKTINQYFCNKIGKINWFFPVVEREGGGGYTSSCSVIDYLST